MSAERPAPALGRRGLTGAGVAQELLTRTVREEPTDPLAFVIAELRDLKGAQGPAAPATAINLRVIPHDTEVG